MFLLSGIRVFAVRKLRPRLEAAHSERIGVRQKERAEQQRRRREGTTQADYEEAASAAGA